MLTHMRALDLLLLRSCPVEFRTHRSTSDTLARLQEAFPPWDRWALSLKPFAGPTNVGAFDGDIVRLRIINMRGRNWLHPELYAQLRATDAGCAVVGVFRYDAGLKGLYALMVCALCAVAGSMTWSVSSSFQATALVPPGILLACHAIMASLQAGEVRDLRGEVTKAIAA
jgi:hypothetical protein